MLGALSDFPEYQYTDHVHDFEVKDVSRPHRPAHAVMCYSAGTLFKVIIVGGEVGNALNLCRGLGAQRKTMQGQRFTRWIESHFPLEVCHTNQREIQRAFPPPPKETD
ncbi:MULTISPECIES: hypothetical protein [Halomonas]|uniref:hypothetical protein n=1 Tax=Halomonas TaxID=2745 RepID=UPI001A8F5153|nr:MULTISPECIES: hypothetical protein [Halomonas]MBN8411137.1 hypothetical protein [Halomonas litopenaei]MBY5927346.1 hypothetical protein [Halomonas sp. DP4Y7-2]MBY6234387.1 hypothetical protein [Halomonas sp. DP4Y7-1]